MDKTRIFSPIKMRFVLAVTLLFLAIVACAQKSNRVSTPEMLAGNLDSSGHFVFRQKLPAGYSSNPHFHSADYHLTVLAGKLYIGYGRKTSDTTAVRSIEAGTFITIPAMQNHYEWVTEETTIQVYGSGPQRTEFKRLSKGTNEVMKHDAYDVPVEMTAGPRIVPVHGDVKKDGVYCIRLKISDGTTYPPHRHPFEQYVTVLKGMLIIGYGEKADVTKTDTLKVGSFLVIDARQVHYEQFPEETIVQIHGPGPLQSEFIKPPGK